MARRQHDADGQPRVPDRQVSFLPPDHAAVLHLVRENLRLLSELRPSYRATSANTDASHYARSARDVADLLAPEMEGLIQEQMRVLLLDTRCRLLDTIMVYQGNVSTAVVRMAELFRDAIVTNAPCVILVHNHPSGEPEPSDDDLRMTKDAVKAGEMLGIDVLDHVILGHGRFVSLKERGVL
jgi:DNA repair protein RadC